MVRFRPSPPVKTLYLSGFDWDPGQIFNEIFNDFSSRSLSGTGTSRTRPLHGCETNSVLVSLQNENAGYDTTLSQIQTRLGHVVCLRQRDGQIGQPVEASNTLTRRPATYN